MWTWVHKRNVGGGSSGKKDNLGGISQPTVKYGPIGNIQREPKLFGRWQQRCSLTLSVLSRLGIIFCNTQQAAMSFRSSVGGDRPTALIVANESVPLQSGLQSIGWPFPVLKFEFEFIFQIKHTESIFIKQHSKTVSYCLKLPKLRLQFSKNNFAVSFIIIFGTLSSPISALTTRRSAVMCRRVQPAWHGE